VEVFGKQGALVAALDRLDTVHDLATEFPDIKMATAVADIGNPGDVESAVASLREKLGAISVLVNNAGGSTCATLEKTTPESWQADVSRNLNGAYNLFHFTREDLKAAGDGAIVNIASVNGLAAFGDPAYSAGKAGLINFTKCTAMEYGRFGIRANAICPGTVRTPAWEHRVVRNPEILTELGRWYPLKRVVDPIEIARAAVFLASSDASAISGVALPVDCGLSSGNIVMTRALTLEEF